MVMPKLKLPRLLRLLGSARSDGMCRRHPPRMIRLRPAKQRNPSVRDGTKLLHLEQRFLRSVRDGIRPLLLRTHHPHPLCQQLLVPTLAETCLSATKNLTFSYLAKAMVTRSLSLLLA